MNGVHRSLLWKAASCKQNQKLTMEIRLSGVRQLQKKGSVTTPTLFLGECVLAFALGYFWK